MRKVPGFDAVGIDPVAGSVQFRNALNFDGRGASAFDVRAHCGEESGNVGDFGLAGTVFEDGFAFGECRGHKDVFRAGDGDLIEDDVSAFEAICAGFQIAVVVGDGCAHLFEGGDVEIDGATRRWPQPPGMATRAMPVRAMSGPRTRELARMVLTISYLATGSERMAHFDRRAMLGAGRSRVRLRHPWIRGASARSRCRGPAGCFRG